MMFFLNLEVLEAKAWSPLVSALDFGMTITSMPEEKG